VDRFRAKEGKGYKARLRNQWGELERKRLADRAAGDHRKILFHNFMIDSGLWASLTPEEKALYEPLWRHADAISGECFPGRPALLRKSGLGEKAFKRARKYLRSRGLLSWRRGANPIINKAGKREIRGCTYYLLNFDSSKFPTQAESGPEAKKKAPFLRDRLQAGEVPKKTAEKAIPSGPAFGEGGPAPSGPAPGGEVPVICHSEYIKEKKEGVLGVTDEPGGVVVAAAAPATAAAADAAPPPREERPARSGAARFPRRFPLSEREQLVKLRKYYRKGKLSPYPSLQRKLRELERKERTVGLSGDLPPAGLEALENPERED